MLTPVRRSARQSIGGGGATPPNLSQQLRASQWAYSPNLALLDAGATQPDEMLREDKSVGDASAGWDGRGGVESAGVDELMQGMDTMRVHSQHGEL